MRLCLRLALAARSGWWRSRMPQGTEESQSCQLCGSGFIQGLKTRPLPLSWTSVSNCWPTATKRWKGSTGDFYDARNVARIEQYGASVIEEGEPLATKPSSASSSSIRKPMMQRPLTTICNFQLQMEYHASREMLGRITSPALPQIENDRVNKQREYQSAVSAELLSFTQQSMSITTSALQQAGMEHSGIYKALFAMQKAAAIPPSSCQRKRPPPRHWPPSRLLTPLVCPTASGMMGYASAGMVAGRAIAGLFDKGGHIPANQFGIVSELGDESFVNGTLIKRPANVTSRRDSEAILARAAGKGGDGSDGVTIIHILCRCIRCGGCCSIRRDGAGGPARCQQEPSRVTRWWCRMWRAVARSGECSMCEVLNWQM